MYIQKLFRRMDARHRMFEAHVARTISHDCIYIRTPGANSQQRQDLVTFFEAGIAVYSLRCGRGSVSRWPAFLGASSRPKQRTMCFRPNGPR